MGNHCALAEPIAVELNVSMTAGDQRHDCGDSGLDRLGEMLPERYGPRTTLYNRISRCARRRLIVFMDAVSNRNTMETT